MRCLILLAALLCAALANNMTKRSCSGTCADSNNYVCSNGFKTGLCPGAANIKCCTGSLCHGQCVDTNVYGCSSGFQTGLCAGASNIKCCSGSLTCGGSCASINSYTCSNGFKTGLCPGGSDNQCCTGSLAAKGCTGTCASTGSYTCSNGFKTGLCPGAADNQCCTGSLTPKSASCSGSCADINSYSCSNGFKTGLCPGGSDNQCCTGSLSPKSTCQCVDVNSNTCSNGFKTGLCPGASNIQCCTGTVTPSGSSGSYNRANALSYAAAHWNSPNHACSSASYESCTPYSYWGGEHCGYSSHGGDCANFVSQCLLAGGHRSLNTGGACRGYPCGREEIGAKNLGDCLSGSMGWSRTCGYHQSPPSNIQVGDVLVYHQSSCSDSDAHATIITSFSGSTPLITCHSSERRNEPYTYMSGSMPYYEWLHISA